MKKPMFKDGFRSGITCPACGGELLVRTVRRPGHQFLGCENYPVCKYGQDIPSAWYAKVGGQATLPGLEEDKE